MKTPVFVLCSGIHNTRAPACLSRLMYIRKALQDRAIRRRSRYFVLTGDEPCQHVLLTAVTDRIRKQYKSRSERKGLHVCNATHMIERERKEERKKTVKDDITTPSTTCNPVLAKGSPVE